MTDKKTLNTGKLWGGRFSKDTNAFVERFTASVLFDKRLYQYDIDGSVAHAKMLAKVNVITDKEKLKIINGLEDIRREIEDEKFEWSVKLEDVHMNIESY